MTIDSLRLKNVQELKALAYDQVKLVEQAKYNLQVIESLIAEKNRPEEEDTGSLKTTK